MEVDKNAEEGLSLALGAIAEELRKSQADRSATNQVLLKWLQKQEEEEKEEEAEKEEELEKSRFDNFMKSVVALVKQELAVDVGSGTTKKVSGEAKWPMSSRPSEADKEVSPPASGNPRNVPTSGAQAAIEAMEKQDMPEEDEDTKGAGEYPMEEEPVDEVVDEEELSEMAKLQKQVAALATELSLQKQNFDVAVKKGVADTLRKAGFREETGMASPRLMKAMPHKDVPIVKADKPVDLIKELKELSFGDLKNLEENIRVGNTAGIPEEIVRGVPGRNIPGF